MHSPGWPLKCGPGINFVPCSETSETHACNNETDEPKLATLNMLEIFDRCEQNRRRLFSNISINNQSEAPPYRMHSRSKELENVDTLEQALKSSLLVHAALMARNVDGRIRSRVGLQEKRQGPFHGPLILPSSLQPLQGLVRLVLHHL